MRFACLMLILGIFFQQRCWGGELIKQVPANAPAYKQLALLDEVDCSTPARIRPASSRRGICSPLPTLASNSSNRSSVFSPW